MFYSFLSTGLLPLWLGLFLGTLFFLLLYQMGLFSNFCFWYLFTGVQKHLQFLKLTLYSTVLPNSLTRSRRFLVESIGVSMYTVMSSANNDSFVSSFPIWMTFISFSCLITVAMTSNTMLNRSGERGHPCLVPDLSGKLLVFAHWTWC